MNSNDITTSHIATWEKKGKNPAEYCLIVISNCRDCNRMYNHVNGRVTEAVWRFKEDREVAWKKATMRRVFFLKGDIKQNTTQINGYMVLGSPVHKLDAALNPQQKKSYNLDHNFMTHLQEQR